MMFLPSGVQPSTMLFGPILSLISSRPRVAVVVILSGTPPCAGMVYTSVFPSYCAVNATVLPSGEKCENISYPASLVSFRAIPPLRGTVYKSPA